jgi:hypothetical protein
VIIGGSSRLDIEEAGRIFTTRRLHATIEKREAEVRNI